MEIMKTDINQWMNTPIKWKEEKIKLFAITGIVLAIIALGVACYFYSGVGRFDNIPGYNQGYAYFLWAVGGSITLGTAIAYLARGVTILTNNIAATRLMHKNKVGNPAH